MKLVCDMTNACNSHLSEENIQYLEKLLDNNEKARDFMKSVIGTKFSFESDHYYNIPFENIQEGDILIADVSEFMTAGCIWEYIRIDHIYRNMIFYTVLTEIHGSVKEKEGVFPKGSIFFSKGIYPCYIVKHPDYTITCDCPLVQTVDNHDEIPEDYRSYEYVIRKERDY